jgi:hypothetical protein
MMGTMPVRFRSIASCVLMITTLIGACSRSNSGDETSRIIERWAPETPAADCRIFAYGDDAEWHALADRRGHLPFFRLSKAITGPWHWTSHEEWDAWWREAGPVADRLARFYEERFDCDGLTQKLEQLRAGGYHDVEKWRRIIAGRRALIADTTLSEARRAERGVDLLRAADSLSVLDHRAVIYLWMSDQYGLAGMMHERMRCAEEAYRLAREARNHFLVCQLLGVIGSGGGLEGSTRPGIWYWHEGRRIAEEHEIWEQWARLTIFLARYYSREGNLARALQMVTEVMDQLDRVDIGRDELRHLRSCARFFMRLECYDMARRVARRIEVVLEATRDEAEDERSYEMFAGMAIAGVRMHSQDWESADSLYASIAAYYDSRIRGVPPYYPYWLEGLNENGQYERTLSVYEGARARLQPHIHANASIQRYKAEAELALGRPDSAAASLEVFDAVFEGEGHQTEITHRDYLSVLVTQALEGDVRARAAANEAFRALEHRISNMSAASQGYLWIDVNDDLRFLMHRLVSGDVLTRYGIELIWSDLYGLLGSGDPASDVDVFSRARKRALSVMEGLEGTVHCLYVVEDPAVWRFTATGDGVAVDTLGAPIDGLSKAVRDTWEWMSEGPEDPSAAPDGRRIGDLTALSRTLLPQRLRERSERRLLITGDGFLRRLPFEALNLDGDRSYVPVASVFDVATVRSTGSPPAGSGAGTLIIAAPAVSGRLARTIGRNRDLPAAREEARRAAAVLPGPTVFSGRAATRAMIENLWGNAEYIYIAAHVVRNREVPFLSLLPLASGEDDTEPYLAVLDVRQADLSGCDMVVLSGCATGAPYVDATISGASLGDAFIDAGAGVVIQTYWEVRDDHAGTTMAAFLDQWGSGEHDPVRALSSVRRDLMDRYPHPYFWASYGVSGRLDRVRSSSH